MNFPNKKGLLVKPTITKLIGFITKVFRHSLFPAIILFSFYIAQHFFAGFYSETIMVIGITALSMLIVHSNNFRLDSNDPIQILRDSLIIGTGSVLLTGIIDKYVINQNDFGVVPMVVSMLLVVLGLVLTAFSNSDRYDDDNISGYYKKACNFTVKIVATIVIVLLLGSVYKTVGTQYIWLSAISLWAFLFYFSKDHNFKRAVGTHEDTVFFFGLILGLTCLISTICEFWFSKIIFGFNLWQCLSGFGFLVVFIRFFIFYKRYRAEKEAKRLSAEKEAKDKAEKKEAELKLRKKEEEETGKLIVKLSRTIENINAELEPKWSDIFFIANYYRQDIRKFSDILPKIHQAPLVQLIEISKIKKQIAFNPSNLGLALKLINDFTEKKHTDEILQGFIDQLVEFLELIHEFSSFKGYEETIIVVENICPAVYQLIPKEKLEKIVVNN